jgi:uncharacterized Zn finger protein
VSAQHTPKRVKVQHPHAGARGFEIAFEPGLEQVCQDITEANARRLAACWNACEGLSTESLETESSAVMGWTRTASKLIAATTQRDELLAALRATDEFIDGILEDLQRDRVADWYPEGAHNSATGMSYSMQLLANRCADFDAARAAIAKATEVTA